MATGHTHTRTHARTHTHTHTHAFLLPVFCGDTCVNPQCQGQAFLLQVLYAREAFLSRFVSSLVRWIRLSITASSKVCKSSLPWRACRTNFAPSPPPRLPPTPLSYSRMCQPHRGYVAEYSSLSVSFRPSELELSVQAACVSEQSSAG